MKLSIISTCTLFQLFIRILGRFLCVPKIAYCNGSSSRLRKNSLNQNDDDEIEMSAYTIMNEWYRIAMAVDRLALVVFVLLIVGVFIAFTVAIYQPQENMQQ